MKYVVMMLAALLFSGAAGAADWYTAGVQTNPLANAVLADTGGVPADSTRRFEVICATTVSAVAFIEWRDATNVNNLRTQGVILPANQTSEIKFMWVPNFATGERVRVRLNAAITGVAQCSILME